MALTPPDNYLPTASPIQVIEGGYSGWVILKKTEILNLDLGDAASWQAMIDNNTATDLYIAGRLDCNFIKGSKADKTRNTVATGVCQKETTLNTTVEFNLTDEANDAAFSNFNPYEWMEQNEAALVKDYAFAVFDKNGNMTGWYDIYAAKSDHTSGETDSDIKSQTLTLTTKVSGANITFKPKPTAILNVADHLHLNL